MVCKDTLRIKHLPKELTEAQKEDFIRHFGAQKVKVITSKAKAKSVVYAKFENEDVAKNVMLRLHQISILNCRLCVEYPETDILQGQLAPQKVADVRDGPDKKFFKNFINNINAFNDSVGFYQPPPSHLKYNYPKANRSTINNIAHALATVPRFYTQVLHLMNKMNLPPPFAMPEPPVRTIHAAQASHHVAPVQIPERIPEKRKAPSSSSESELESDGESNKNMEIIPQKRIVAQKKALKRPKFIKQPPVQNNPSKSTEKTEDIFEKVNVQPQRKIELKVIQEPAVEKPEPVKQIHTPPLKKNDPLFNKTPDKPSSKPSNQSKSSDIKPLEQPLKEQVLEHKKSDNSSAIVKIKETKTDSVKEDLVVVKTESVSPEPVGTTSKLFNSILDEASEPEPIKKLDAGEVLESQEKLNVAHVEVPTDERSVEERQEIESNTLEVQKRVQELEPVREPEGHQDFQQETREIQSEKPQEDTVKQNKEDSELSAEPQLSEDEFPCISLEELAANQITDLSVTPVFKSYSAGEPTNKLYIKNCAKTVAAQDLEYIYNRYREECTKGKPSEFNIRLMQEGRMKGQAFVTLDSVEQAQRAVKETNGFILKDKPLVVVFGKTGKKK